MALLAAPPATTTPALAHPAPRAESQAQRAAKQFEAILVQQLLATLRKTLPEGSAMSENGPSGQYMAMLDQAVAEQLSSQGGIGLASVLSRAFGGGDDASPLVTTSASPFALSPSSEAGSAAPAPGVATAIAGAAATMSAGAAASHWSRDGALTHDDLASELVTPAREGAAHFNVADANGFEGDFKCNLFALEAARRAGYAVPVMARPRGWGFPSPDGIVRDLERHGRLSGDWATVATSASAGELDSAAATGQRAFVLVGGGTPGHSGHMAVVERVHRIDRDPAGAIRRIVFDGWEARPGGAGRLENRTWNVYGNPGGTLARDGLGRIEVLELRPADAARPEVLLSRSARASLRDASSSITHRPNQSDEETP